MMLSDSNASQTECPRLLQAMEDLRAAREAGQPLSRDSFLARYPDLAADLGPLFDTLEGVRTPTADLELKTFGNFQILGEAARGGMGIIYQAIQLDLGRVVALKVLAKGTAAPPRARERFRQEAAVAAQLHHTHIVPVFGTVQAEGRDAYTMPFIEGPSLAEILGDLRRGEAQHPMCESLLCLHRQQRLEYVRRMAELAVQVAEALAYAHRHGVLHRDVKPANLLVEQASDGRLHLWLHDFGLARVEGTEDFARPGDPFGTPGYQSPEQAAGQIAALDERSDVFSLGATLFELLALRRPEGAGDLRKCEPAVPRDLALIVAKCLAPRPEDRYASAEALADDLRCFLHDYPIQAHRPSWRLSLAKWAKRHRRPLWAAAATFLLTAVVGTLFLVQAYRAERAARHLAEKLEEMAAEGVATFHPVVDNVLHATSGVRKKHGELAQKAYAIHEQLLAAKPDSIQRQRGLASASWRLARAKMHLRENEKVPELFDRSIALYEGLSRAEPNELLHRLDVLRSLWMLSEFQRANNRPEEGEILSARMIALAREIAVHEVFKDDLRCQDAVASYLSSRGRFLLQTRKDGMEAAALFREANRAAQVVRKVRANDYHSANPVVAAQHGLAEALDQQGKHHEATAAGQEALETLAFLLDAATRSEGAGRLPDLAAYYLERSRLEPGQVRRLAHVGRWDEATALLARSRKAADACPQDLVEIRRHWLQAWNVAAKELAARKAAPGRKP